MNALASADVGPLANDVKLIKSGMASTKEIAIIGQAVRVMPGVLAS